MAVTEIGLKKSLREISLEERIKACKKMIGKMCSAGRPPKMTIPVHWDDEDFYITNTLKDVEVVLNPRLWTEEMHRAWHQALPDVQAAFEALREIGGIK